MLAAVAAALTSRTNARASSTPATPYWRLQRVEGSRWPSASTKRNWTFVADYRASMLESAASAAFDPA